MKRLLFATLLLAAPAASSAHEIWIERDGGGPARIYLGEPAEPLPPGGDPEFANLKAPKLIGADGATQVRKAGYIEAMVPAGDVRAWDGDVFKPWGPEGKKEGITYYARAGRAEPKAAMPYELAPTAANGSTFTLWRNGQAVADAEITVISPDKWTKKLRTDAAGTVTVPTRGSGRYLLTASAKTDNGKSAAGEELSVLHETTTTTFVVR